MPSLLVERVELIGVNAEPDRCSRLEGNQSRNLDGDGLAGETCLHDGVPAQWFRDEHGRRNVRLMCLSRLQRHPRRPYPDLPLGPIRALQRVTKPIVHGDGGSAEIELQRPVLPYEAPFENIHRRFADEVGDESVVRLVVDLVRRPDLGDASPVEDGDAVAHGYGFDPVRRRVEGGHRKLLVEQFQLAPHVVPELGVEVDDRLVHQESARLAHEHASQRRALPLTAAEL